jgi:hypothetical protein
VSRGLLALIVASVALSSVPGAGVAARPTDGNRLGRVGGATITLRAALRYRGPWQRRLSLKLVKGITPIRFYVCAVWSRTPPPQACRAAPGTGLPAGTTLRLEQHPVGPAAPRADSPGWGLVATSTGPALQAVLSNNVSGNRFGTVSYRVTLRSPSGHVFATSNRLQVVWHR